MQRENQGITKTRKDESAKKARRQRELLSGSQESADLAGYLARLRDESQVAAVFQRHELGAGNPVAKVPPGAVGYQHVPVADHDLGGDADAVEPILEVELLGQLKAMGHDALVGAPALLRDEMKERVAILGSAKQQVEELIDERIVWRQRVAAQYIGCHPLQQRSLEAGTDPLDCQGTQAMREASGKFQRNHATEGYAQDSGRFQTMPVEELNQVLRQVSHAEPATEGKAILLATELVADDPEMAGEKPGHGPKQLEPACQSGYEHQWRAFAPFTASRSIVT